MKLRFYSTVMQSCDAGSWCLHQPARLLQSIRDWAWRRCTAENLRTCQTRTTSRTRL